MPMVAASVDRINSVRLPTRIMSALAQTSNQVKRQNISASNE